MSSGQEAACFFYLDTEKISGLKLTIVQDNTHYSIKQGQNVLTPDKTSGTTYNCS